MDVVDPTEEPAAEVAVVTLHRAVGEGLVRTLARRGLRATVFEPRGQPPNTAGVLVLDLTNHEAAVVAVAASSSRDDPHPVVIAVGDVGAQPRPVSADAWVRPDARVDELVDAIRTDRSSASTTRPIARPRQGAPEDLTVRELEVLSELLAGGGAAGIGERLGISEHTVRTHIQNVLGKLGVNSRAEAASWALRQGLAPAVAREQGL